MASAGICLSYPLLACLGLHSNNNFTCFPKSYFLIYKFIGDMAVINLVSAHLHCLLLHIRSALIILLIVEHTGYFLMNYRRSYFNQPKQPIPLAIKPARIGIITSRSSSNLNAQNTETGTWIISLLLPFLFLIKKMVG